eukprot:CAMPEP_0203893530 /NCGR_PEP_ID=MMETSP0359-20131031/36582_1 /ASSEMBLY_ACC=CAM_ASM_000338 /TAXON_ID=268821 /ORGANISM="Scrippsiella Hangoei, Strain SHTV-5" /LENGTH=59 /DNA_ID=CAMNT_0050815693 /DNA_START=1 /DNA_END=176 /DNA_ORIENTATION=+
MSPPVQPWRPQSVLRAAPESIEVHVGALEDIPRRGGAGDLWQAPMLAVRVRWPSRPELG